jgi:hypothetical protein
MTVNRGLDGPLFLCPDADAMKHTILNKILNALTFGLLNRISDLEHNHTMSVIETAGAFNKLDRVDTDVSALEKRLIQQGDSLTDLRQHVHNVLNTESEVLKDLIRKEAESIVDDMVRDAIREKGLVREKDLPDFDDYFTDNDSFCDRVVEIMNEHGDFTDRDEVCELISDELDEKNFASKSDVEDEVRTAIETHEEVHHTEEEEDESQAAPDEEEHGGRLLNDLMKPMPVSKQALTSMALTEEEVTLVRMYRAYNADGPEGADHWSEVMFDGESGSMDGFDCRTGWLTTLIQFTAEYSARIALWLEHDAYETRKGGQFADGTCLSIQAHGYDEAFTHLMLTKDIIERSHNHAYFVSERIEDPKA